MNNGGGGGGGGAGTGGRYVHCGIGIYIEDVVIDLGERVGWFRRG